MTSAPVASRRPLAHGRRKRDGPPTVLHQGDRALAGRRHLIGIAVLGLATVTRTSWNKRLSVPVGTTGVRSCGGSHTAAVPAGFGRRLEECPVDPPEHSIWDSRGLAS